MRVWRKARCATTWQWTGKRVAIASMLAVLAVVALPGSAGAAAPILESPAGALDPGFASGGVLTAPFGTGMGPEEGRDAAVQSDGKIVVLISGYGGGYLVRFLPNGELDTTFGSGGNVALPPGNYSAIALDSEGRIVVAGAEPGAAWQAPDKSFEVRGFIVQGVVYRLLSDGAFDPSFGANGKAVITVPPPEGLTPGSAATIPLAILTTPSGGSVVGGRMNSICAWEAGVSFSSFWEESGTFVARLNSNGSPENQFGSSGLVSTHGRCKQEPGVSAETFDGLIQSSPETALTLAGNPEDNTWRFRTYSSTGTLTEAQAPAEDENPLEIALMGDRYVVLSEGSGQSGLLTTSEDLHKFTLGGVPDSTFGINGRVAIPSMACEFGPGCLAVLPDEHIVVAGRLYRGLVGVRRFLANGSEDDSFGANSSAWAELTHEGEMNTVNKLLISHGQPLVVGAENVSGKPYADNETALTLFEADGGFSSAPPSNPEEGPFSPIPSPGSSGAGSRPGAGADSEGMTGSSGGTGFSPVSGRGTVTPVARPPVAVKPLPEVQKLAMALKMCRKDATKRKRKLCVAQARKRYKPKLRGR